MAVFTLPEINTSVTDLIALQELMRKFGNARRRAFSLKRKGVVIPCFETTLQQEIGNSKLNAANIDSFWLDIKGYDEKIYRRLCGTKNKWKLKKPHEIVDRVFGLYVLTLFIPKWLETDQITKIAEKIAVIDPNIPFPSLAFFPECQLPPPQGEDL